MGVPVRLIGKESVRVGPQSFQWCVGQLLRLHISQGLFIDPVVLMARSQKSQKVDTALRLGAAKPGKQLITNVGGVSILAAMARTRVIYGEIARAGISRRQQPVLLRVERSVLACQQRIDLPGRNVNAPLAQLL